MDDQQHHTYPLSRGEIIDRLTEALRGRHDLAQRIVGKLCDDADDGRAVAADLVVALEDHDLVRERVNAALLAERFPGMAQTTTVEGVTR